MPSESDLARTVRLSRGVEGVGVMGGLPNGVEHAEVTNDSERRARANKWHSAGG